MTKATATDPPILVCRYNGDPKRFFAKYKDPDEQDPKKRWKKIPGGPFAKSIDTEPKATACARKWVEVEMADRKIGRTSVPTAPLTWPDVCDAFHQDVDARVRGADGSRDELKKRAVFLRSNPTLCARPVAEHDEEIALIWLRQILAEPIAKGGRNRPRDPLTIRNIGRVLGLIYKFAERRGCFPAGRRLPTENQEFKAEISGALKEKAKTGKPGRLACPIESARAIVGCLALPELRRVTTYTSVFTGVRPGELHGLRVSDYREECGVLLLDVRVQWTMKRKDYPSREAPPKTLWGRRKIPVHASLKACLDAWIASGWERHVGRRPKADDFLFPDADGDAFRETSCQAFLADLERAGCETSVKGVRLDLYSLRHTFATAARRAGISSDARDLLLGHRPKDTKAMHYEDEDLPLLATEIAKLPRLLDQNPGSPDQKNGGPALVQPVAERDQNGVSETAETAPVLVQVLVPDHLAISGGATTFAAITAEEQGFEPWVESPPRRFSKPLRDRATGDGKRAAAAEAQGSRDHVTLVHANHPPPVSTP